MSPVNSVVSTIGTTTGSGLMLIIVDCGVCCWECWMMPPGTETTDDWTDDDDDEGTINLDCKLNGFWSI